jgi:hypothetical protein
LEAIPGIDEDVVREIQTSVVAFYGEYDEAQEEPESGDASDQAPGDAAGIERAIDQEPLSGSNGDSFESLETGVLEHDLAKHESALLKKNGEAEILDLGLVEGLSGAPSSMRGLASGGPDEAGDGVLSDTIDRSE